MRQGADRPDEREVQSHTKNSELQPINDCSSYINYQEQHNSTNDMSLFKAVLSLTSLIKYQTHLLLIFAIVHHYRQ